MKKSKHIILGVHVTDRVKKVAHIQKLLTEYGCSIKTRIGLHEVSDQYCAPGGVILLEMAGPANEAAALAAKLNAIAGVECKRMVFDHP